MFKFLKKSNPNLECLRKDDDMPQKHSTPRMPKWFPLSPQERRLKMGHSQEMMKNNYIVSLTSLIRQIIKFLDQDFLSLHQISFSKIFI